MNTAGMSTASRRVRRLTIGTVAAVPLCLAAGVFELDRALGGNELSWVYALEWPFIGAYVVYMRRRLVREAREEADGPPLAPSPAAEAAAAPADASPDAGLAAWNAYLSRLHAADPPGGPPAAQSPRASSSRLPR